MAGRRGGPLCQDVVGAHFARAARTLGVALGPIGAAAGGRCQSLLRHAPVDDAERAAGLLEDVAVRHHARDPAAAARARPRVLLELAAVELLDGLADLVLRVRLEAEGVGEGEGGVKVEG